MRKGSALVVGEQIYDAQMKGLEVEFMGYAFDDPKFGNQINGFPILAKTKEVFKKFKDDSSVKFIFQLYRPDLLKERIKLKNSYGIPDNKFILLFIPAVLFLKVQKLGLGLLSWQIVL